MKQNSIDINEKNAAGRLFTETYPGRGYETVFCPYRVCPLGAHVDHQGGVVTGYAINEGISVAYSANADGKMTVISANFDGICEFSLGFIPLRSGDWADHVRAAASVLSERYKLDFGITAAISGSLCTVGLSSSAAVIIAVMTALCAVNGIKLAQSEAVTLARAAENSYVGVACGTLDQSCEVYSRRNNLLYLDTDNNCYELIKNSPAAPPFETAIFDSGIKRSLASTGYNNRVDECRAAAAALARHAGIDTGCGKDGGTADNFKLCRVPREVFDAYGKYLPESQYRRAYHYYGECERVRLGAAAWREGNIAAFGAYMTQSGESSVTYYEAGSEQLSFLYRAIVACPGVYGGRFSGAGFGGCCIALINPLFRDEITLAVTDAYCGAYPALRESFSVRFTESADGIGTVSAVFSD